MFLLRDESVDAESRDRMFKKSVNAPMPAAVSNFVTVTAQRVEQEQLGDLKLYRVPERTTLASRQSKQVRLMDRLAVPVTTIYQAELMAGTPSSEPARRLLRTRNTRDNRLGLPLPSGSVAVFAERGGERLLQHESGIRDTAVDEDVEIDMGVSPEVQVSFNTAETLIDSAKAEQLPLVPGIILRSVKVNEVQKAEVMNARPAEIQFELKVPLPEGARIVRADHAVGAKNGRPIFRFKVPANEAVTVRFQTQNVQDPILRTP